MILTAAEAMIALGIAGSTTDLDQAVLTTILPEIDAAISKSLFYDPQYRVNTDGEYYPANYGGNNGDGYFDVGGGMAHFVPYGGMRALQLRSMAVRSIEEIRVDYSGGFGQKADTFGTDKIVAQGTDWYMDLRQPYFCETGIVYRQTAWPTEPGSVLVKYTAGYTQWELSGRADSGTDPETGRTASRINASGIKKAARLILVKSFKTARLNAKQRMAGFVGGPLTSERLGGYSYSASGVAEALVGMKIDVPPEAMNDLQPYIHMGIAAL